MTESFSYRQELGRKLVHISSLWMLFAIWFLSRSQALLLFGGIFALLLTFEFLRRTPYGLGVFLKRLIAPIMREGELAGRFRLTGASYTLLAGLLCAGLFPRPIAVIGMGIMVVADAAASLVGKRFGRHKLLDKSWEGSATFLATAWVTAWVADALMQSGFAPGALAFAAVFSTLVELVSGKLRLDDNLSVALAASIGLWICV